MTLNDYLAERKERPNDFAVRAGVSQPHISRLLKGERFPGPDIIQRIQAATEGAVTANDWIASRAALRPVEAADAA